MPQRNYKSREYVVIENDDWQKLSHSGPLLFLSPKNDKIHDTVGVFVIW